MSVYLWTEIQTGHSVSDMRLSPKWKEVGVDFQKNCVFIDEAGFNNHMVRGRAWSKVGSPANIKLHQRQGVNVSIVGCISVYGTINFSRVEPLKASDVEKLEHEYPKQQQKKRKAETQDVKPKAPSKELQPTT